MWLAYGAAVAARDVFGPGAEPFGSLVRFAADGQLIRKADLLSYELSTTSTGADLR